MLDTSISEMRKTDEFNLRLFGSINKKLTQFLAYSERWNGKAVSLNTQGKLTLWLMTKDALWRSINYRKNFSKNIENE